MDFTKLALGPWKRCSASGGKCPCGLIWSVPADRVVATVEISDDGFDRDAACANAEFIVMARNAFDGDQEALTWWEANRTRQGEL